MKYLFKIMPILLAIGASSVSANDIKFNIRILDENDPLMSPFNPTSINDKGQIVSFASVYDYKSDTFTKVWDIDPEIASFNPIEINNKGDMAGMLFVGGIPAAAAYIKGNLNIYGTFEENDYSVAEGINNKGTVVTWLEDKQVVFKNGSTVKLEPAPGDSGSIALSINDRNYSTGTSGGMAAMWDDKGNITVLPNLEHPDLDNFPFFSFGNDINKHNQVVGQSHNEAVLWDNGTVIPLNSTSSFGNVDTFAHAINNSGWIVGDSGSFSTDNAFLWKDGSFHNLNDLVIGLPTGWQISSAIDINNKGFIVGNLFNQEKLDFVGYVLTPVPEPTTWAMLLAGLGLLVTVRFNGKN